MKEVALKSIAYFGTGLVAFLAPIHYAFLIVILFVAVDTITGVMAAGKENVKNITSKKMFSLVPKIIFYFLLIITAHACSYIDEQIPFVKLAMFGIGTIEIRSIDENFDKIYGFSFVNKILEGIKSLSKVKR
jgi:phage-related holin